MSRLLLSLAGAMMLAAALGSGPAAPAPAAAHSAEPATKPIRIALLPKKKGVPYFTSCYRGAQQAAADLGNVELLYDGPMDGSPEKAAAQIERWTLQKVDVIAVSPNDPDVLAPAMRKARQKGVRVITWDADGQPDAREFLVNQATPQEIGFSLVDQLVRDLGESAPRGKVAIITATLTAANQNEWIRHIRQRLADHPGLELVAVQPSNEDQKLAFQVTRDLLGAHSDLRGIFAISSVAFPGAAEALRQAGRADSVHVIGLSTPNDMKAFVKDGTVRSVILWNTLDLGYLTVQAAAALHEGRLKAGDSELSAGRLGVRKVAGDQVLLGGPMVFNRENIDQHDF